MSRSADLVRDYHRHARIHLPNEKMHATLHAIVEALGDETPARRTAQRLMDEGLDRHDAIHAIGLQRNTGGDHNDGFCHTHCVEGIMFAILRGANGRRHEVDFDEDPVIVDVTIGAPIIAKVVSQLPRSTIIMPTTNSLPLVETPCRLRCHERNAFWGGSSWIDVTPQ